MRRAIWATTFVVLATACGGDTVPTSPAATSPSRSEPTPSAPPSEDPSPNPSIEPVNIPAGTPASFPDAVDAAALPADALVPTGTTPTDTWPATSPDGTQFALIAFAAPSDDPLRQARGLVMWRRFDDTPPWRPVYGLSDPAHDGVLEIHSLIGDATGDGSPDALTFEDTGGSGACGTWRVLDLAANAGIFRRTTCDTTIELSGDPTGLVIRRSIYDEGDAHCCPSAIRITVLTFDNAAGWEVFSSTERSS
jgi:hypothetical protein